MPYKDREVRLQYYHEYRKKRRRKCIEYLGGECVQCGWTSQLEFDHIDPASKEFNIATNVDMAWNRLLVELDKCQLLCKDCHKQKSYNEPPF